MRTKAIACLSIAVLMAGLAAYSWWAAQSQIIFAELDNTDRKSVV